MRTLWLERAPVLLGTALMLACTGSSADRPVTKGREASAPPASESAQTPEEHKAAIEKARAGEAEYARKLAAEVQAEARNDAWASQKEQELKKSYSSHANPRAVLKSITCRSTKCDLQFDVAAQEAPDPTGLPFAAINEWIAASQPCGYTIMPGEAVARGSEGIRIFLDCGQQSR